MLISKSKIKNYLFLIFFLSVLFLPLITLAQGIGIVPCGGEGQPECKFCHLFVLLKNIIDFILFYIVFPIATLILVIGGMMFLLYGENPQQAEQAKSLLTAAIIGLVIIFSAWLVVGLFFTAIGLSNFAITGIGLSDWFTIDCPI